MAIPINDLHSKTALVTGAGSGISLSFAASLLSHNCNVVFADLALTPEAQVILDAAEKEGKAVFVKTDVTEWAQLERAFAVAVERYAGVDIVCPGAGVYEPVWSNFWSPPGKPPSRDTLDSSRYKTLDVNLNHPIRLTQIAIEHFLSRKKPYVCSSYPKLIFFSVPWSSHPEVKSITRDRGVIVHISSVAGQTPFFPTPIYVASKHAVSGFVRSLAGLETPPPYVGEDFPRIRVVAVAPARVRTRLWTDNVEKMKFVPKDEEDAAWVTPEFVAEVMLDLVTKAENVGGTILEVGKTVRRVEVLHDAGPASGGNIVTSDPETQVPMWESLKLIYEGKSNPEVEEVRG